MKNEKVVIESNHYVEWFLIPHRYTCHQKTNTFLVQVYVAKNIVFYGFDFSFVLFHASKMIWILVKNENKNILYFFTENFLIL